MNENGFRSYLINREIPAEQIEAHLLSAKDFENYLFDQGRHGWEEPATREDFLDYSEHLIQDGKNDYQTYLALIRYAYFAKNDQVYLAILQLLDGSEVMDNLYQKLTDELDEETRDRIFQSETPPPFGTSSLQKSRFNQVIVERMISTLGEDGCKELLKNSLRDLPDEWYKGEREKYLACANLDEFLQKKGDDFIAELEAIKNEGRLYFNQKINDEVIAYVNQHPEIRQGERQGNILYEAKIPYMTIEYLVEQDQAKKRYYYCHCPWARESLTKGETPVSATFCNCSAGFHKKYWEMVFDQPLEAEVIETVLNGDPWCRFAIYLPDGIVQQNK